MGVEWDITVNRLFFVIEKFSSLSLLTKIFHPKIFLHGRTKNEILMKIFHNENFKNEI